jgi:hypothetical protein
MQGVRCRCYSILLRIRTKIKLRGYTQPNLDKVMSKNRSLHTDCKSKHVQTSSCLSTTAATCFSRSRSSKRTSPACPCHLFHHAIGCRYTGSALLRKSSHLYQHNMQVCQHLLFFKIVSASRPIISSHRIAHLHVVGPLGCRHECLTPGSVMWDRLLKRAPRRSCVLGSAYAAAYRMQPFLHADGKCRDLRETLLTSRSMGDGCLHQPPAFFDPRHTSTCHAPAS